MARVLEEAPPRLGERLRVEAVERGVARPPCRRSPRPRPRRARRGVAAAAGALEPSRPCFVDPRADAVHEDRELLHVLRAVREALPRAVAGGVAPARERGERDPADAAREEELEGVDRVLHDRPLVDAVAQPVERLADEAREGERGVERPAEVGPLDAERGELVRRLHHEVAPLAHVGRRPAQRRERALERGERPVLRQRRRRGDEPGGEVREDLAGPHAVRADLVGDDEPAGARAGRGAEHVHLREAGQRDDPVAPLGVGEGRVDEPADVVEPLVDRVVEDVAAVLHRDAHQLLDERARVDAAGRVVRVVEDDGGDPALARGAGRAASGSGRNSGAVVGSSTTVLPARSTNQSYSQLGRGTTTPEPSAPRTSRTMARPARVPGREEDLVGQEADLGGGVVEEAVAVEELGDLAPDVHPADRGAVAVDRVPRDPLRGPDDLGVRREVGVLVVALGQVERALLLDAAREEADERLGRREGAGGEAADGRRPPGQASGAGPWSSSR